MKKLLIVHTRYQFRGGEDIAVDNEIQALSSVFKVEKIIFENNQKLRLSNLFYFLINSNYQSINKLKQKILTFKPDIVYVHNTWFMGSLGIFKYLKRNKIITILKLHNFRYFCTRSFSIRKHLVNKDFCQCCALKKSDNFFFNKYFQDSYLKSILVNYYGKKYLKIIQDNYFKIIVLTQFHKSFLIDNNIRKDKIYVNANPHEIEYRIPKNKKENFIVYAGRITQEKGVKELIEVFLDSDTGKFKLKIIGIGPQLEDLRNNYKNNNLVEFLGELNNDKVLEIICNSDAVITYTKLFEGQPTLLTEASLLGIPSIFPDTGGIAEFFPKNYIFMFEQFNNEDLKSKLNLLSKSKDLEKIGIKNKKFIKNEYSLEKVINKFVQIVDE